MADELLFKIGIQGNEQAFGELAKLKVKMQEIDKSVNDLNKDLKAGKVSLDDYGKRVGALSAQKAALKKESDQVSAAMKQEQKEFSAAVGSMDRMSAELTRMRAQYRALSEEERNNAAVGGKLLTTIQQHDASLKKLDATMGNHQRNVGNYKMVWDSTIGSMLKIGGVVGIATMAFGGLKSAFSEGLDYAIKMEARMSRLTFALDGNAKAAKGMSDIAGDLAKKSLFTKGDIMDAEAMALSLGRTQAQAKIMVETAMGLSRALGVDLNTAMMQLSGTFEGNLGRMGRLDIRLKGLSKEQLAAGEAVTILHGKMARFGQEGLETVEGRMKTFEKTMDGFKRSMATGFIPLINLALEKINKLIGGGGGTKKSYMEDFTSQQMNLLENSADKKGQDAIIKLNEQRAQSFYKLYKSATDANDKVKFSVKYDEQLEIVEKLKEQQKQLEGRGFVDTKKEEKDAEDARKKLEENLKKQKDAIKSNNDLIQQLARQAIDDQIAAMQDGKAKELAVLDDKYNDEVIQINNERRDRLQSIRDVITETKAKGDELKKLEDQKAQIIAASNKRIEALQESTAAAQAEIEKKYSKSEEDKKITDKYSADVARTEEEGKLKLDVLKSFYEQKGSLTKKELQQQKDDELKLAIEVAQKKYDLLYAEIQARRTLGTITKEEYDNQLKEIARLYGEVKKLTGEQADNKAPEGKKTDMITGGIMKLFNIDESQASQIKSKAKELLNQITTMWLDAQRSKIQAELKAETAKADAIAKKEIASLDYKRKKGLITEAQYAAQKDKIDQDAAKKKEELNRKAFEKNKKLQLLTAIINGAMAVIAAAMTPYIGAVMAILTGIMVAAEIATIASTKYEGARGGLLRGKSHAEGGIRYNMGGDVVELEGGEAVINKHSIASNDVLSVSGTPRGIASYINSYNGRGVPFAQGGYTPVSTPATNGIRVERKSVSDIVDEKLQSLKVFVVDQDISDQQARTKKIQVESQW